MTGSDSITKFALSLALVTSLAPVATDMYLASMPDIAAHMGVSYASVQFTLSVYLLAQGAGQLVFGPVTDRFGRRWPLLAGIIVFALASFWAGCSQSIGALLASRFIQGLSGALLLVVCFSSVSDSTRGATSARIFAILMTVEGLAPIFAPIIGGFLDEYLGWRFVLWASSIMALLALFNSVFNLKETLPGQKRIPLKPSIIVRTYANILMDRKFLLPALTLSGVFFYLFAYIGGGAYFYQTIYGMGADRFGMVFGLTGSAVMFGALASNRWVRKAPVASVARYSIFLIIGGTFVSLFSFLWIGLWGVVAGFAIALFGMGAAEPALVALTMSSQDKALGFTAALMGALQLLLPSASTPISGYLLPLNPVYWFIFLLASGAVSLCLIIIAEIVSRRQKQVF